MKENHVLIAALLKEVKARNGRLPHKAELVMASVPYAACLYAQDVIKGPWAMGEKAIATHSGWSYHYAALVIKTRFHLGEKRVCDSNLRQTYLNRFPDARKDWESYGWIDWIEP